jgi:hypothetical protein
MQSTEMYALVALIELHLCQAHTDRGPGREEPDPHQQHLAHPKMVFSPFHYIKLLEGKTTFCLRLQDYHKILC